MSAAAHLSGRSVGRSARSGSGSRGSSPPGAARVELEAQVDGGGNLDGAPYPVARSGQDRLAFQSEQGRHVGGREEPAGVPEPHVVGHEDEERSGEGPVAQPPEPLGEARPVGGESLPDDPDGPAVRQRHGGVHRHGPVPAEPDGVGDVGEGGGDVVDGGERVEPVHQDAPPLGGDGMGAHQLVEGDALLSGEPAQPCGGEMEPPGGGKRVYGVGHGGAEPAGLQARYGLVDGAPRPAADGNHLQPVEEGH